MFETRFIDRLFDDNDNKINRKSFVSAITGDFGDKAEEFKDKLVNILKFKSDIPHEQDHEDGTCNSCMDSIEDGSADWLFSAFKLRLLFRNHYR
jgi:hypothetical protein